MSKLEHLFKQFSGKKVLVAPLDWGLGHVTRCIPIIRELRQAGAEVILAGEGAFVILRNREFPEMQILPLKGYRIKYAKSKYFLFLKLILQLPKIRRAVRNEKKWLDEIIDSQKIEVVISDNRLGLSSKKIPCYFITHQLQIKSGFQYLDKIIQKINYSYINSFQECWVPDLKEDLGYAGELSHPKILPKIPVQYLGLLSRFHKSTASHQYKIAVVLSGPEPQRTILEKIIIREFQNIDFPVLFVRGLPTESESMLLKNKNIEVHNHLSSEELSIAMQESEFVLSRSGYSTIMDLIAIQKQAILIPTPGQTEQEYLAKYLSQKGYFQTLSQSEFKLDKLLQLISG